MSICMERNSYEYMTVCQCSLTFYMGHRCEDLCFFIYTCTLKPQWVTAHCFAKPKKARCGQNVGCDNSHKTNLSKVMFSCNAFLCCEVANFDGNFALALAGH